MKTRLGKIKYERPKRRLGDLSPFAYPKTTPTAASGDLWPQYTHHHMRRPFFLRRCATLAWRRLPDEAHPVFEARVAKPWRVPPAEGACLLRVERLVPVEALEAARKLVLGLGGRPPLPLDRDEDSVDGAPTFECRWVADGRYTNEALAAIFRPFVETQLLPLLRRSPLGRAAGDLVLCEALVRVVRRSGARIRELAPTLLTRSG